MKVGQGKIALSIPYRRWMEMAVTDLRLGVLPITVAYAERQSNLRFPPYPFPVLSVHFGVG